MAFTVRIRDETGANVWPHPELKMTPERWSDMAYGGPDGASILMDGPQHAIDEALSWLYYELQILGHDNQPVWWGFVNEIDGRMLYGLGWWHMLDARYYENLKGREENLEGTSEQALGLGFTSSELGTFAYSDIWYENDAKFAKFEIDDKFVVVGTYNYVEGVTPGQNDGTYTVKSSPSSDAQESYTATTISFAPNDNINDSASGFRDFRANEYVQISGATNAANNGPHMITDAAVDKLQTREGITGILVSESAGNSITIEQGNAVDVTEPIAAYESPGDATGITVTAYGQKIAQKFQNNTGEAFTVDQIAIKIRKEGSPTDNITVALYSDNSGDPGTLLDSGTILAADITTAMAWHWASLSNTDSIATSTDYWIVITRAGSMDYDDFYKVGVDEETSYTSGVLKLYDDDGWVSRQVAADLTFKVWGAVKTTVQVGTILEDAGQAFSVVDIFDDSGIETNQYRDGLSLARSEAEALLDQGTSNDLALRAMVTVDKSVYIEEQADGSSPAYALASGADAVYSTGLDDVFNRIQVLYTYTGDDGQSVSDSTDWASNNDSITRYGYRELRHSETELSATEADALRDRILGEKAWPALAVDLGEDALTHRRGGPVEAGRLISGEWVELGEPPVSENGLMSVSPLYIVSSEYDAGNNKLTVRPATAPDPWDIGGVTQG